MAGPLRTLSNFIRLSWEREPMLVVSVVLGTGALPFAYWSPLTYKQQEDLRNWPSVFNMYGLSTDIEKIKEPMSMNPDEQPTWTDH